MNTFSSACLYSARTQPLLLFSSSSPQLSIVIPKSNQQQLSSSIPSQVRVSSRRRAAGEMGRKELERELEEWVVGIDDDGRCSGCVGGRDKNNNIVEVMECLEREAIMGEDEGREPTDYYRRAHIFDKSSRLFQALKDHTPTPTPTPTQQQY